jgi:glucose/arabinose dehydrogenase
MHHCGHIEFGPQDRLLYLCIGDTQGNAHASATQTIQPVSQDPTAPLGKILRLDVGSLGPIVELQPGSAAAAEASYDILAMGLRNPWRFTFDPVSGDMFIPDVSRFHWDEIEFWPASGGIGANFGWPLAEGNECIAACDAADLVWPIYEYAHRDNRCAVIGGAVYRGSAFPEWQGVFVFGDLCSGEIWALRKADDAWQVRRLADTDLMPHAFGTRFDGEILVADRAGAVWRFIFPDLDGGEWVSADQAMFAMITDARRAGFSRSREQLKRILVSRSWWWARRLASVYRYLIQPFN